MYKGKEYKLSKEIIYFEDSREFGFVVSDIKKGILYKILTDGKKINYQINQLPEEVQAYVNHIHEIISELIKIKQTFSIEKIQHIREVNSTTKSRYCAMFNIKDNPLTLKFVKYKDGVHQLSCSIKDPQYSTITNTIDHLEYFFGEEIMGKIWGKIKKESSNRIRLIYFNEKAE